MKKEFSLLAFFAFASAGTAALAVSPTDVFDDPALGSQWQWDPNRGGVSIAGAWEQGVTGEGVVIGIVDEHVDRHHEDLNILPYNPATDWHEADLSQGLSFSFKTGGGNMNHGTACAGLAAAIGGNGVGIVGAAPGAAIAGVEGTGRPEAFCWGSGVNYSTRADGWNVVFETSYEGDAQIDVKSHSYATYFASAQNLSTSGIPQALRATAANNVIHCFSAGNMRGNVEGRGAPTDAGWMRYSRFREVILVAATNANGTYADFSSFGSSVFISAPGETVRTTDRMGADGYDSSGNYASFNGTSAATPIVAGVTALGKQICPDMDVRWAKHALAWSSGHGAAPNIDSGSSYFSWENGPTGTWQQNNGGYWFNNNYGFGLVDAEAFVDTVRDILYTTTERTYAAKGVSKTIAGTSEEAARAAEFSVGAAAFDQNVETVSVRVNFSQAAMNALDLRTLKITLVAPDGNESVLVQGAVGDVSRTPTEANYLTDNTFLSNAFWGSTYGEGENWTVRVEYDAPAGTSADDWVSVGGVEWTTGGFVFEGEGRTVAAGETVSAHAVAQDSGGFAVAGTMKLEDSVLVNDGKFELAKTGKLVYENKNLSGDKGLKYTQNGGEAVLCGTADFARGITLNGGSLAIRGCPGTISAGTGIVVNGGTLTIDGSRFEEGTTLTLDGGNVKIENVSLVVASVEIVLGDAYLAEAALSSDGEAALAEGTSVVLSGNLDALLGGAPAALSSGDAAALDIAARVAAERTFLVFGGNLKHDGVSVSLSDELERELEAAGIAWTLAPDGATLSVLAVPEPSAFGLLAGTFALALAASRRRRKA